MRGLPAVLSVAAAEVGKVSVAPRPRVRSHCRFSIEVPNMFVNLV